MIMRVFMSEYLGLQPDEKKEMLTRDNGELVSFAFPFREEIKCIN